MDRYLIVVILSTVSVLAEPNFDIWPHPKSMKEQPEFLNINPQDFSFKLMADGPCEILHNAIVRYMDERMFVQDCSRLNPKFSGRFFMNETVDMRTKAHQGRLEQVVVQVQGKCESMPHVGMKEAYTIDISNKNATIQSKTVWGALRGLETFSQMIRPAGKDQFVVHLGHINDEPRFEYRGFMIDTSRHFIPMKHILETLDAMEMNKFNVLHWHLVDDQSFPFVSTTFPELSKKGAYRPHYIYSVEDVKNVIEYARLRGIRVLPEFDTPGHTQSWGRGQPGLLTKCYDVKTGQPNGKHGPIDPIKNSSYEFIDKLFHEIVERFADQYIHLGGDEVDFTCWKSNPEIQEYMKKQKFGTDYWKLESVYIQKLINIVNNLNRSYIVWQEVFDNHNDIRPETVVHVWKGGWEEEMNAVTEAGFHSILSSCWYLNYISYGTDWYKYYQCEPFGFNGTDTQKKLVIGGEACMWAEWVDGSNLISRTWPRASAVAERLWSPMQINDPKLAKSRFHVQRCRMQMLGLRVSPIEGPDYCWCDDAL